MTLDISASPVGNVLRLKGGGPSMTVTATEPSGLLRCRWFVGNTLLEHLFAPDVLEPVTH